MTRYDPSLGDDWAWWKWALAILGLIANGIIFAGFGDGWW